MRTRNSEPASFRKVWIGLALVSQPKRGGSLGDADRAYVNVLARAKDESDFRAQIKEALIELNLTLIELEDAETMEARLSKHHIHNALRSLANKVKRTGKPRFDVFQTFDLDGG